MEKKKFKVVITGGPSGGKTTLIEALQKDFSKQISVAPEAASILYKGGWPRKKTNMARRHTQRAILFSQRELEDMILASTSHPVILCDRGSLDSLAYWPSSEDSFFEEIQSNRQQELARYEWVLHMDTAPQDSYDGEDPIRTENYEEAAELNEKIKGAWSGHPRRFIIGQQSDFFAKLQIAKTIIEMIVDHHDYDSINDYLNKAMRS
jgi:nicotinamide riboside kinase